MADVMELELLRIRHFRRSYCHLVNQAALYIYQDMLFVFQPVFIFTFAAKSCLLVWHNFFGNPSLGI